MSPLFLACSGPGALDAMATSSLIGVASVGATVLLTGAAIRAHLPLRSALSWVAAAVALLLILAHPGVWLGVGSGDCGYTLRYVAPGFTVLHGLAAGFLIARRRE